ncbi:LysE/ArgO family amino acid transporter [Brevibacillus humidisoli]|uniref:LysE/ArgO family amino acid transporter n=1 Tax=Brevibacillus humidisoli TaxID=2895522 RepID=UPI001E5C1651|nr:LysE/ArgO family amino acid transporter [Brevibacillus humidisoli]UFJ40180.1 LysE/ArgO family amino acid transporter [Brevibacillus humidisoli]
MITAFLHGFLLALGLILPLGVQNVFIFNQGATQPRLIRAVPAVLTATLCDMLLILLAVLGVSLIVLQVVWLKTLLFGAGLVFLLYMGWSIWRSPAGVSQAERPEPFSPRKQIAFAASVSLLNPHAIMDTIGVIGTSSLQYDSPDKWVFTASCILVSFIWFVGLAVCGRLIGRFDGSGRWLLWINRLSAVIIWGVAAYMGWQLLASA